MVDKPVAQCTASHTKGGGDAVYRQRFVCVLKGVAEQRLQSVWHHSGKLCLNPLDHGSLRCRGQDTRQDMSHVVDIAQNEFGDAGLRDVEQLSGGECAQFAPREHGVRGHRFAEEPNGVQRLIDLCGEHGDDGGVDRPADDVRECCCSVGEVADAIRLTHCVAQPGQQKWRRRNAGDAEGCHSGLGASFLVGMDELVSRDVRLLPMASGSV